MYLIYDKTFNVKVPSIGKARALGFICENIYVEIFCMFPLVFVTRANLMSVDVCLF